MLDAVGYIWLIVLGGPFIIAVTVLALPLDARTRWIVASVLGAWFLFTVFTAFPSVGRVPGALLGIVIPVLAAVVFYVFSPQAQRVVAGVKVPYLVGLHATRVAGGAFILLHSAGRLSNPFAAAAGWGDLLAASLAIPAAIIAYRQLEGWEKWVFAWNVIGLLDFVSAVTFGLTSQPGSPLQVFMESPGTAILADLPWRMIPGFYVPLFIIAHLALFIRLWPALSRESQHRTDKSAAMLR
jgi:hypothetical protein